MHPVFGIGVMTPATPVHAPKTPLGKEGDLAVSGAAPGTPGPLAPSAVTTPFTSTLALSQLNAVPVVAGEASTVMFVRVLIRYGESILISTRQRTRFGLLEIDEIDAGKGVNDLNTLLLYIRKEVFKTTGFLIAMADGTDDQLQVSLSYPYANLQRILCHVLVCDSYVQELRNGNIAKRPFLNFVTLRQFSDSTAFPRAQAYAEDIALLYAATGYANFPNTEFLELPSPPSTVPSSGVKNTLGTYKPIPPDKFYGFDHAKTPADFDWKEYVDQTEVKLRQCVDADQKYAAFRDLFVEDGFKYVTEYENKLKEMPGISKTFEGLRDLVQSYSPLATRRSKAQAEFDKLKMGDNTEEAYVKFQREFGNLTTRIGGYTDQSKRKEFCKRINATLLNRVVNHDKCPEIPDDLDPVVPDTSPPVSFTYEKLADLAMSCVRKNQSLKHLRNDTVATPSGYTGTNPKRIKREQKRLKRAQTAKMEAMYTEAERAKVQVGKNGTFRVDGTVKTCNNCNSPDHLASDCPKGPMRMSAADLQKAKSGAYANTGGTPAGNKQTFPRFAAAQSLSDSNLSKKNKQALKLMLAQFQSQQASGNTGVAGASTPAAAAPSGNGQAAVAGNQQLSGEMVARLLRMQI